MPHRTITSTINIDSFPHLFDQIVSYVYAADDVTTLSTLRASGRSAKRAVDKRVSTHMVVTGSRPCSRYYSVWNPKLARGSSAVSTIDVLAYDEEGSVYANGACSAFLRNARPRFLRVYGQRAVPLAPSVRALIQVLTFASPIDSPPVLLPKLHNVFCIDAHTAANLTFFDLEPCGAAHLTIALLPFFAVGHTPHDMGRVFGTLNHVVRWAEDQLDLHPGLTIAFLGLERRRRGFAFQVDWTAVHEDRVLQWSETAAFDMHVDFAERMGFIAHSHFRHLYGEELHRLVIDT